MPISMTCDKCDRELRLKDEMEGKRIRCPDCGATLLVESDEGGEEGVASAPRKRADRSARVDEEGSGERPRRRRPPVDDDDEDDRPRRRRRRSEDEDDDEDRPRRRRRDDDEDEDRIRPSRLRRKKQGGSGNLTLWLSIGGGAVLLIGIVLVLIFVLGGDDRLVGNWDVVTSAGGIKVTVGEMKFTSSEVTFHGRTSKYDLDGNELIITHQKGPITGKEKLKVEFISKDEVKLTGGPFPLVLKRKK